MSQASQAYSDLQESFSNLTQNHQNLLEKNEFLQIETSNLTSTYSQLHLDLTQFQKKETKTSIQFKEMERNVEDLEGYLLKANSDKDRLKLTFEKSISKLSICMEEIQTGKQESMELESTLKRYEYQIVTREKENTNLQRELNHLKDEHQEYREEVVMVQELVCQNMDHLKRVISQVGRFFNFFFKGRGRGKVRKGNSHPFLSQSLT